MQKQLKLSVGAGALIAFLVLAVIGLIVYGNSAINKVEDFKIGKKYETAVVSMTALDQSTLRVSAGVANIGDQTGRPECRVRATEPTGQYRGSDTFEVRDSLAPGSSTSFVAELVITNEGAEKITEVTIDCK